MFEGRTVPNRFFSPVPVGKRREKKFYPGTAACTTRPGEATRAALSVLPLRFPGHELLPRHPHGVARELLPAPPRDDEPRHRVDPLAVREVLAEGLVVRDSGPRHSRMVPVVVVHPTHETRWDGGGAKHN